MFIGTAYGIENKILPTLPYEFRKIVMRGLRRRITLANLLFPLRLFVSVLQCIATFMRFKPGAIIGTGGYVSGPPLLAGLLMGIPTVIQEQNSYPGLVNRVLGKKVSQVHLTFEDSRPYFQGQKSLFISGNPVRTGLTNVERSEALATFGLQTDMITLFVFGGSQGAHTINKIVVESLPSILALDKLQVLWATGDNDWQTVVDGCGELAERVKIHRFVDNMAAAYGAADFVLCRSGATTLAEISKCGLPAILVPYPYAAERHQEHNARSFAKAGAATLILEPDLTSESLASEVARLYENRDRRTAMAAASKELARPNAAQEIADHITQLL